MAPLYDHFFLLLYFFETLKVSKLGNIFNYFLFFITYYRYFLHMLANTQNIEKDDFFMLSLVVFTHF